MVSATSPVSAGDTLRYPPTSEPDDDSDEGFYAVWPEVHEGLRCGEFEVQ
jgi:hypothetical protein